MGIGDTANLVAAFGKLIGSVIWPAVVLYIIFQFRSEIKKLISSLSEITLRGGGFEAVVKRKQDEAGAALTAATVSQIKDGNDIVTANSAVKEAVRVVEWINSKVIRHVENSLVLWVDDNPSNNNYERQAFEALGVRFVISTSTEKALEQLSLQKFDAIISDMGRPPDSRAGYTLLSKIRELGDETPYIIYAGSRSPEHVAEAKQRGAAGCTNKATELFQIVVSALTG